MRVKIVCKTFTPAVFNELLVSFLLPKYDFSSFDIVCERVNDWDFKLIFCSKKPFSIQNKQHKKSFIFELGMPLTFCYFFSLSANLFTKLQL